MSKKITPHIVFFPSLGMGHLTPFLRLASLLSSKNCEITLIITYPINYPEESAQISNFFSTHPNINCLDFNIVKEKTSDPPTKDAFICQFKEINSSIRLFPNLLSSINNPISAIFSDFAVAATLSELTKSLKILNFIVSTTSACCYTTVAHLPLLHKHFNDFPEEIQIPGLSPLPKSFIPLSWLNNSPSNRLINEYLIPNAISLPQVSGILLNSFNFLELETISNLLNNKVLSYLPPLYPIGPLKPYKSEKSLDLPWLDTKPEKSVVYLNLGNSILSIDQIREIEKGLEMSGYFFLWVLKETMNQNYILESFLERTKNKGKVIQVLVNQAGILAHPSIGGFVTQCDWDSVTESTQEGVPMLTWPQHGDHKMNAEVVEKAGFGIWVKEWGWGAERLVSGEEIEARVRELMEDEKLKERANNAKIEANRAFEIGGNSENVLMKVLNLFS